MSETAPILRISVQVVIWLELRPPIGHENPGGYYFKNDRTNIGYTNLSSGEASTLVRLMKYPQHGDLWLPDISDDSFIADKPIGRWLELKDEIKETIRAFWKERFNEVVATLPELRIAFPNWRVSGLSVYNHFDSWTVKFRGYHFHLQNGISHRDPNIIIASR